MKSRSALTEVVPLLFESSLEDPMMTAIDEDHEDEHDEMDHF